jgi:hypothetical protein
MQSQTQGCFKVSRQAQPGTRICHPHSSDSHHLRLQKKPLQRPAACHGKSQLSGCLGSFQLCWDVSVGNVVAILGTGGDGHHVYSMSLEHIDWTHSCLLSVVTACVGHWDHLRLLHTVQDGKLLSFVPAGKCLHAQV